MLTSLAAIKVRIMRQKAPIVSPAPKIVLLKCLSLGLKANKGAEAM